MEISLQNRYRGALLGLAAGDAVGTSVEFAERGSFPEVTDMTGGGPFSLQLGQWTDDTSMALCLATSLIHCKGFDALDQMNRYVNWYRLGYLSSTGTCFDIGNATRAALHAYEKSGDPFSGSTDPKTAGNGSLMRLVPVVLAFRHEPSEAIRFAASSSRTTHGALVAVDACRYFAALLMAALGGVAKERLLSAEYSTEYFKDAPLCKEIAEVAAGSFKNKTADEIIGSGYAALALEAALWAFSTTENFKDGCLRVVNLGDDADTTAAIFGQIAGAFYGIDGIPQTWRKQLAEVKLITDLADGLLRMSTPSA